MLTLDEEKFLEHWAVERTRKKKLFRYTVGLPLGVLMVTLLFINIMSGWDVRAISVLRSNSSFIIVIVLASIGIVAFLTIFSSRYQWEQKEQRYKELQYKKDGPKNEAVS